MSVGIRTLGGFFSGFGWIFGMLLGSDFCCMLHSRDPGFRTRVGFFKEL